ncbi:MAG: alpha/beta hydrolase [Holosporales bacterium]
MAPLDPAVQKFLDAFNQIPKAVLDNMSISDGRTAYLNFALMNGGEPLRMARVEDTDIVSPRTQQKIPLRIYTPILNRKLPALVYFHGGGWHRGSIATHDSICRYLSTHAACIVVSVEWRLSPENPFSTGLDDCLDAYLWAHKNAQAYNMDPQRIAVGGDSAGGNMTAVTTQRLRDEKHGPQACFQLMCYPATDLTCSFPSYDTFAEGYFLTKDRVIAYATDYVKDKVALDHPMASPLKAKDFRDLPPAHIITAGYDPLRDEGHAYFEKLQAAGVPATYTCYESMIHAFLHMSGASPAVKEALIEIATVLKNALYD